ncbi:uncharacterized protein LOC112137309 isoform X2 [Oryzias melastigma]|uniref:uncharacterized protein LOC112137309 isoform X2 n=1 Tax=Oryzias melastigma TaxID=30732 RepID=UPI00168CD57E|nr:uncharacterized protein LOC112137309 isoform X2 [Oryzias melastigma]
MGFSALTAVVFTLHTSFPSMHLQIDQMLSVRRSFKSCPLWSSRQSSPLRGSAAMSGKAALLFALLVALLVSGSASPPRTDGGSGVLAHKGAEPASRGRAAARVQRRAHLTEDEREMVTKQIVQALSGMVCSQR